MRTATLLAAFLFALPVAGCGGDEADEPTGETTDDGGGDDHGDHEHGEKAGTGDSSGDGGGEGPGDQSAGGKGKGE